jgi:hypothetical protein
VLRLPEKPELRYSAEVAREARVKVKCGGCHRSQTEILSAEAARRRQSLSKELRLCKKTRTKADAIRIKVNCRGCP